MRFRAALLLGGKTATGIPVPDEVLTALGPGRRFALRVTLGQHAFRTTTGTVDGTVMIPVSAAAREAAGVEAGQELDVDVELDLEPRTTELPADLAAALAAEPQARAYYDGLTASRQKAYATWVDSAKKPETRDRRLAETVQLLLAGRPQR